jgi:hypothetical protein
MTLVARLAIKDFPLLIGDVLVSAPKSSAAPRSIPTVGQLSEDVLENAYHVPTGLYQKIAVISDNLVIGWAGTRVASKLVVQELIEQNAKQLFTNDTLMQYFEDLDHSIWQYGVSFVGFVKDAGGVAQFGQRYMDLPTSLFGRVGLIGTGVEHMEKFLQSLPKIADPSRQVNALEHALSFGLITTGSFLAHEIATLDTLLTHFGGGYEIASLVGGKFAKLDDITYLFWYGKIDEEGAGFNLHQVYKHSYLDDLLLIRSASLSEFSSEEGQMITRSAIDVIPPVYRDASAGDLKRIQELASSRRPSFDSKWLCSYFIVPNEDSGVNVFAHVHYSASGDPPIRFLDERDRLVIAYKAEFLEGAIKQAYDTFQRRGR